MDPYLELPENWRGVHSQLISIFIERLNECLALPFAATIDAWCNGKFQQRFINIIAVRDREVIATIELLSPVNKSREGRHKYQRKQSEILKSDVHLIEIDLLRGGEHTVHIPLSRLQKRRKTGDYLICLHHAHQCHRVEYWAVPLSQKLPVIAVPLTPETEDVPLDLQSALDTLYDRGAYARILDYNQPLIPALSAENQSWVDQIIESKIP